MNTPDTMKFPAASERSLLPSMWRGFLGRCPHCGEGKMFRKFLKVVDRCEVCGEELHHHRADDAPAYFVIAIVGHVVVALAFIVEVAFWPPLWVSLLLWLPLTLILAIGLLQPIKGALVGLQWSYRMHGFDPGYKD
ncbi:MAG TPA: DUF983 domain-containing protein [Xanthobacteraceae bacterium]|jgi:uncharacterized protein (DUF983 family)|nr:DUF983 domain-containing protein [Xanthobacteraceae bacterium]